VTHEPRIQQLSDDLERAGYHPFHAPCGIRLLEGDKPNSVCIRCATCDGFPSLVLGKSDAEVFGVRPALRHPNVTLLTNAQATRLTTDDAGTIVTGVEVEQGGQKTTFRGDIVVVSGRELGSAAPQVGERPPPERPSRPAPTRSAGTHVPQQHRGPGDLEGENPTKFRRPWE
jgi:choline dehydrogenase-like flavoprotein